MADTLQNDYFASRYIPTTTANWFLAIDFIGDCMAPLFQLLLHFSTTCRLLSSSIHVTLSVEVGRPARGDLSVAGFLFVSLVNFWLSIVVAKGRGR